MLKFWIGHIIELQLGQFLTDFYEWHAEALSKSNWREIVKRISWPKFTVVKIKGRLLQGLADQSLLLLKLKGDC